MGPTAVVVKREVSANDSGPSSSAVSLPRRGLHAGALILVLLAAGAGCRTTGIRDFIDVPLPLATGQEATEDVDEAIWRAGRKRGWKVERLRPGVLRATWHKKHHVAVVSITHTLRRFSIRYESSQNLLHSGDRIHHNYNVVVQRLAEMIQREPITPTAPAE